MRGQPPLAGSSSVKAVTQGVILQYTEHKATSKLSFSNKFQRLRAFGNGRWQLLCIGGGLVTSVPWSCLQWVDLQ